MAPLKPETLQKMYHWEMGVLSTQWPSAAWSQSEEVTLASEYFFLNISQQDNSHIQTEKGEL